MPDLLILSDDVKTDKGFEEKMKACLYAAEKHGIVFGQVIEDKESLKRTALKYLPEYSVTRQMSFDAVMIKESVIDLFGPPSVSGKDPAGALAEYWRKINDFGFSAVVAHHALYSFKDGRDVDMVRDLGLNPFVRFLTVLDDEYYPKKRILFECAYMPHMHCGTIEVMVSAFESFNRLFGEKYDVWLYTNRKAAEYHGLAAKYNNILYPDTIDGVFHLGYIPNQAMWYEDQVLVDKHCLRVIQNMLDVMMVRTINHLPVDVKNNVDLGINLCDGITFISGFSESDFLAYYANRHRMKYIPETKVVYVAKKQPVPAGDDVQLPFDDFFLLPGGLYKHKAVNQALEAVACAATASGASQKKRSQHNFIVIGMDETGFLQDNIYCYKGGHLDDALVDLLYKKCKAVISPSLYEGFGLSIVMALRFGKRVILYKNTVNTELCGYFSQFKDYFLFFGKFNEIPDILDEIAESAADTAPAPVFSDSWDRAATDLEAFITQILSRDIDTDRLARRSWVYKHIEARSADVSAKSAGTILELSRRNDELELLALCKTSGSGFVPFIRSAVKEILKRRCSRLFWSLKRLKRRLRAGDYASNSGYPKVSILIPNRDNAGILRACVRSVLKLTAYKNYEIIILENNSIQNETFEYYNELEKLPNVHVLKCPDGSYNYQKIMNFGVHNCGGDYILQLNNDTVLLSPNWLDYMLEAASDGQTGAVGAILYYPDRSIQFMGGTLHIQNGAMECSHLLRGMSKEQIKQTGLPKRVYETAWVTGACLLVKKSIYEKAGGMDEDFTVTYGDVDLCMRLEAMGLRNVIHPYVVLIHDECTSRGFDEKSEAKMAEFMREHRLFLKKWKSCV